MSECTCPSVVVLDIDCPVHGALAAKVVVDAIDRDALIQVQPRGRCELCGAVEETRPYGPNGEEVCFDCGMKDEPAAGRAFERRVRPHPEAPADLCDYVPSVEDGTRAPDEPGDENAGTWPHDEEQPDEDV